MDAIKWYIECPELEACAVVEGNSYPDLVKYAEEKWGNKGVYVYPFPDLPLIYLLEPYAWTAEQFTAIELEFGKAIAECYGQDGGETLEDETALRQIVEDISWELGVEKHADNQ